MAQSYLDKAGLSILWNKIKAIIPQASSTTPSMDGTGNTGTGSTWARADHVHPSDTTKVDKVSGKGLSTNDFTTTLKNKLDGIASGAEVNVNADWNAASGDSQILNKPTIPSAGTGDAYPVMDGTRALGSQEGYARVDHVHPSDTSRVPTTRTVNGHALSGNVEVTNRDLGHAYGTCSSTTATTAKVVDSTSYGLHTYGIIAIKFSNAVTTIKTLNVNGQGAKYVSYKGILATMTTDVTIQPSIEANSVVHFMYDGTYYVYLGHTYSTATSSNSGFMTTQQVSKLNGIATGAEVNVLEGVQLNGTDLTIDANKKVNISLASTSVAGAMSSADKTKLDSITMTNGVIDSSCLPSFVDDVVEAYPRSGQTELSQNWLATGSASGTVITPETGKIYILMADSSTYATNTQFRWGGSAYVKLNDGGVTAITETEINTICV